jgi:hypothetical protein
MVRIAEGKAMIGALLTSLALSLVLTIVLEAGFFLLIGKRDKKDLLLLLLVNVLTNPVVVLSFWLVALYTDWNARIVLILLELFAVLIEGYYYKKYGRSFRYPYLFSLAANIVSFGTGVLIQQFF